MKPTYRSRSWYLQLAMVLLALSFGVRAFAESPREELVHAYVLLKLARNDYGGHREAAIRELEAAGHELGLDLKGQGSEHERQLKSDELVAQAGTMLHDIRRKLEARDRDRVAVHVDIAIREINKALRVK
jgi:hypothetical protein